MKALIVPIEIFTASYTTGWELVEGEYTRQETYIDDCVRIAQVVEDDKSFEVAAPLFWVDAPKECTAGNSYYKDGAVHFIPEGLPPPEAE